jgi:hypothetical protein
VTTITEAFAEQLFAREDVRREMLQELKSFASLGAAGRLVGHVYIHEGEDSPFVCERWRVLQHLAKRWRG